MFKDYKKNNVEEKQIINMLLDIGYRVHIVFNFKDKNIEVLVKDI